MKEQKFEKVVEAEGFNYSNNEDDESYVKNPKDSILIWIAIPFLGSLIILLYFLFRDKKVTYRRIE